MCKSVNNGSIYPICRISRHSTIARAELVRRERDRGRTIYVIARELGVTQNAVRRMLGIRKDQQ